MRQETERAPRFARPFFALFLAVAAAVLAASGVLALRRAAADRANLATGNAKWIWLRLDFPETRALHFRAWKEFRLEAKPSSAAAKLFVDPRGTLTINSTSFPATEQRPGSPLRLLDAAPALVAGVNRVAIEAESPTGAGGILFSLDLPDGKSIVSDSSWKVLSLDPDHPSEERPAAVWGRPPMYPWGYPGSRGKSIVDGQ
ncbi:MAG TPA: hypothetical protein VGQ32_09650 [Thermoanaerobaculia bacterium]|nr:hypothetical protein [Thermoanaerobaculia bacterium]